MTLAQNAGMKKPVAWHYAAHTKPGLRPFANRDACVAMWSKLRRAYPRVLSAVIMPDHVQFVASELTNAFPHALRGWTREIYPGQEIWLPVDAPKAIANETKLRIDIRYVHLNPCRDRLVADPLAWEWSTHRDALGAVADPWLDLKDVSTRFGSPRGFHRFVSCDLHVRTDGTSAPARKELILANPAAIAQAAASALRARLDETRERSVARRLAVHLADSLTAVDRKAIRERLKLSEAGYYTNLNRPIPAGALAAGRLILSDARLMKISGCE